MPLNFLNNGYFAAKVGIGTNSPDAKLHVEGGIGIFNVSDDWQQSTLGTYLFRGANFATTISNETSTLKIFPATTSSRAVGNYWGGINFMHLDPENSNWGTSFTGSQFWIGGRITSLPGQELSALVFATNSSNTAGSSPTEKMVILPNGNVGIGTVSPDSYDGESDDLVVASGVDGAVPTPGITIACLGDTAATGRGALRFADGTSSNAPYRGALEYNHNGDDMSFRTSGTIKMSIGSSGAIKFNAYDSTNQTGTPTYLLGTDASGNVVKVLDSGGTVTGTGVATRVAFWSGTSSLSADSNLYWDDTNNRLGIGTETPSYQLSIENHATTTSTAIMELDGKRTDGTDGAVGELIFSNNGDTFATVVGVRDGADNSGSIVFQTQDSGTFGTRMTISSDGNVGIGVSNPETARLLVRGSTNDSASQIFQAANFGGATKYAIRADGDNKWYKSDNGLSMVLTSAGDLGIGATGPYTKLLVGSRGTASIIAPPAIDGLAFDFYNDGNPYRRHGVIISQSADDSESILDFETKIYAGTNSTKMTIRGGGDVGIGTIDPQSKLQVDGGIQMADDDVDAVVGKVGTMRYRTGVEYVEVTSIELVTNGDFATDSDWTKGTGWTISGGKANGASAGGDITQAISIPINKTYRVNYTISNYSSGIFRIILGGYVAGTNRSANGTYTDILTVSNTSSNSLLYLAGDVSAVTLSIDNVSVMEVTAEDASYADMCMQTGASTYEWVNIVRNTY